MKAYILCILIATIINLINEKFFLKNSKRKKAGIILWFLSLVFICFIAGVRDYTVGFDIRVYVTRLYNLAINNNIFTYLKECNSDLLFALIVYVGGLFKNLNVVLFFIELAVALPIYIYAYKTKEENSFTLTILIFLLTMYCVSLSLMRQSIAISICILAYYYYNKEEKKKAYLTLFLAVLCHKTAAIFLVAFFINKLIKSNLKDKKLIIFFIIILMIMISFLLKKIIPFTSYANYLSFENREFSFGSILKRLFWLILVLICCKKNTNKEYKDNMNIAVLFLIISFLTTIVSFSISGVGRIGYYFTDLSYFMIMFDIPKKFNPNKPVYIGLFVTLLFFWWIGTYVPNDSSRVYPYHSNIAEFLNER